MTLTYHKRVTELDDFDMPILFENQRRKIKLELCIRCKRPNYYDIDEKHYDSGEINNLSVFCTFCKHKLSST